MVQLERLLTTIQEIRRRHANVDASINRDSGHYQKVFRELAGLATAPELLFYRCLFLAKVSKQRRDYDRAIGLCNEGLFHLRSLASIGDGPEPAQDEWKEFAPSLAELRNEFCSRRNKNGAGDCNKCVGSFGSSADKEDNYRRKLAAEICKDAVFAYDTIASAYFAKARLCGSDKESETGALDAIRCALNAVGPKDLPDTSEFEGPKAICSLLEHLAEPIRLGEKGISCLRDIRINGPMSAKESLDIFHARITYTACELAWLAQWYASRRPRSGKGTLASKLKKGLAEVLGAIIDVHSAHIWAPIVWATTTNSLEDWQRATRESFKRSSLGNGITIEELRRLYEDLLSGSIDVGQLANNRGICCIASTLRAEISKKQRRDESVSGGWWDQHTVLVNELENHLDRLLLSIQSIQSELSQGIGQSPKDADPPPTTKHSPPPPPLRPPWKEEQKKQMASLCRKTLCDNVQKMGARYREDQLLCLRTWNSYTPSLPRNGSLTERGGGFFLSWRGIGLALDPGAGFVANLYAAGLSVADINAVFVSHSHPDHMADVETILQLLHEMQKPSKSSGKCMFPAFYCNRTSARYLYPVLYDMFKGSPPLTILDHDKKDDLKLPSGKDCRMHMSALPASHSEFVSLKDSAPVGVRLELKSHRSAKSLSIIFTGDTGWMQATPYDPADIVIANIGTVRYDKLVVPEYYEQHLGLKGTYNVMAAARPTLGIVAEFGEELRGYRSVICSAIQRALIRNDKKPFRKGASPIVCIPGDRGLRVLLNPDSSKPLHIACNYPRPFHGGEVCGCRTPVCDLGDGKNVRETEEGIWYLCHDHREV